MLGEFVIFFFLQVDEGSEMHEWLCQEDVKIQVADLIYAKEEIGDRKKGKGANTFSSKNVLWQMISTILPLWGEEDCSFP